ncbi:large conductance mechanosensitive channel protein MscL [Ornithinimicrobium cryptoxanthini]|uniref:Large-conductance mechanosensitive channel n=1 Tax=Ornithinimicrobium cryptoxanthini TaxID=2934161 RepID=A0ABY4YGD3_9MICO|nr:large conductance mechanosensitive channel protein MscL [Ornithinimicrobium cryptoxanthini]USQ75836.1 large conductance mechanosensitive channel protein MscL [Ornithinimicrobium cryptoxanthini]
MLQGFKDFIMRGNIVDLAVAVVIGTAFAKVVEVVVGSLITPLLNAMGGAEARGLGFEVISGNSATYMDFAAIINALIVFLLTALVVYFVIVVPMNKVNTRMGFGVAADEAPAEDVALLTEIRDLLARGNR